MGGLLAIQEDGETYLPAYDAMGNLHVFMTVTAATLNGNSYSAGDIVAAYDGADQGGDGQTERFARRAGGETDWQYDAFGRTLRESGDYAASNPFCFSTKYTDIDVAQKREDGSIARLTRRAESAGAQKGSTTWQTSLVYYGYRYYSPSLGRFINRDPIEEQGGVNLYSFVGNNSVNAWDYLGMITDYSYDNINEWADEGIDGNTIEDDRAASIQRHTPSWMAYAEQAASDASQRVAAIKLQNAMAALQAVIDSGEVEVLGTNKNDNGVAASYTQAGYEALQAATSAYTAFTGNAGMMGTLNTSGMSAAEFTSYTSVGVTMGDVALRAPSDCSIVAIQHTQKEFGLKPTSEAEIKRVLGENFSVEKGLHSTEARGVTAALNSVLVRSGLRAATASFSSVDGYRKLLKNNKVLLLHSKIQVGLMQYEDHIVAATASGNGGVVINNPRGRGGEVEYSYEKSLNKQYPINYKNASGQLWVVNEEL